MVGKMGYSASKNQDHFLREAQGPPAPLLSGPTAPIPAGSREDPEKTRIPQRRYSCLTFTLSCLFSISAGTPRLSSNWTDRQRGQCVDLGTGNPQKQSLIFLRWWGYQGEKGTADTICRSQWGPGEEEVLERVPRSLQETDQGNNLFWTTRKCLSLVQGVIEKPDHLL